MNLANQIMTKLFEDMDKHLPQNRFIDNSLETAEEHEAHAQNLHQMAKDAHFKNEEKPLMRQGYLHHMKVSCGLPHKKWEKSDGN